MNQFQRTFFLINRKFSIFESALIHRRTHCQVTTSYIKYWGLGVYVIISAPHQLLQRQTVMTPAIPKIYNYRYAQLRTKPLLNNF